MRSLNLMSTVAILFCMASVDKKAKGVKIRFLFGQWYLQLLHTISCS